MTRRDSKSLTIFEWLIVRVKELEIELREEREANGVDRRVVETGMDAKTRRKHLNDHSAASRDIELTEVAISILERVTGAESVVKGLKEKQQVFLRRIDAAAEKLGASNGA